MRTRTQTLQAFVLILSFLQLCHSFTLTGTVRDFKDNHPDFEKYNGAELGIIADQLGADMKPVYKGGQGLKTSGKANFDQWFNDVDGVNTKTQLTIELVDTDGDGIYSYSSSAFFPIDNQLFGNQGRNHNFHFTFELHTKFTYEAGQIFSFTGDDDIWVFINGQLMIDLGGTHGPLTGSVELDKLGLTIGNTYALDFFFAERHTDGSNFIMETSIELKTDPCAVKRAAKKLLQSN